MLTLIEQGIRFQLKDKNWLIFNMVFPIALLLMTSYFMANTFNNNQIDLDHISMGVYATEDAEELANSIKCFQSDITIDLLHVDCNQTGLKDLEEGKYKVFVELENDSIKVYSLDESYKEKIFVISMLENIASYMKVKETTINNARNIDKIAIKEIKNDFSSANYYGVVVITMMILYVMIVPLCLFSYDNDYQIKERICMCGYSMSQYYIARIISSILVEMIIIYPIFGFTVFVLKTNWGANLLLIGICLFITIVMAVFLSSIIYKVLKSYEKSLIIIQTLIIPVWSFLGGNYIQLKSDNYFIDSILWLSPLRWLNQGIFRTVYINEDSTLKTYLFIAIGVTSILSVILFVANCRREK